MELNSTIITETDEDNVLNFVDDVLIEEIWHDLDRQITRERIRQVATEEAAGFRNATVTTFVPIFVRRWTRDRLGHETL